MKLTIYHTDGEHAGGGDLSKPISLHEFISLSNCLAKLSPKCGLESRRPEKLRIGHLTSVTFYGRIDARTSLRLD